MAGKIVGLCAPTLGLLETMARLMEVNHLMLARSLVDGASDIIPLTVLNPRDYLVHYTRTTWWLCVNLSNLLNLPTFDKPAWLFAKYAKKGGSMTAAVEPDSGRPSVPEHLLDLFERSSNLLNPYECSHLAEMLIKFPDVFAVSSDELGHASLVTHTIFTAHLSASETSPPTQKSRSRYPYQGNASEKSEVGVTHRISEEERRVYPFLH